MTIYTTDALESSLCRNPGTRYRPTATWFIFLNVFGPFNPASTLLYLRSRQSRLLNGATMFAIDLLITILCNILWGT